MSGRILHGFLDLLLKLQSAICPRIIFKPPFSQLKSDYIFGQGALSGQKLYLARAELTACEVVAVYNALINLKKPQDFATVRRTFFRRGALTLWPLGFLGGNPYSIGRVLGAFGVEFKAVRPELFSDGLYIISFWNGPKSLSLHTVFAEIKAGSALIYNMYSNGRAPRAFDVKKLEPFIIRAYFLGENG